jgi:hypothetical protein
LLNRQTSCWKQEHLRNPNQMLRFPRRHLVGSGASSFLQATASPRTGSCASANGYNCSQVRGQHFAPPTSFGHSPGSKCEPETVTPWCNHVVRWVRASGCCSSPVWKCITIILPYHHRNIGTVTTNCGSSFAGGIACTTRRFTPSILCISRWGRTTGHKCRDLPKAVEAARLSGGLLIILNSTQYAFGYRTITQDWFLWFCMFFVNRVWEAPTLRAFQLGSRGKAGAHQSSPSRMRRVVV